MKRSCMFWPVTLFLLAIMVWAAYHLATAAVA